VAAGAVIQAPPARTYGADAERMQAIRDALMAGKVCAYAQGLALIRSGSDEYGWGVDLAEIARIWKGGCIIRARFLDRIREAFGADAAPPNLLVDPAVGRAMQSLVPRLRATVAEAQAVGIPVPALASSLAYFDSYRTADLPQNLIQAQRDAFGAHTYQRRDDPDGEPVHTDWLG
jgi:6-phosphogluconate dehydrogenase